MKVFSLFAACALAFTLGAETIKYDLKQEFGKKANITFDGDALVFKGPGTLVFKHIKIDPKAKYTLSAEFKKDGDAKTYRFYGGFYCHDKKGRQILHDNIAVLAKTDTALTAAAKVGDKTITVKDASAWTKAGAVAFNTKPDYSDLPNYDIVKPVSKIEKKGNAWVVTLTRPLKKNYPAGTAVREHRPGGYIYTFYNMPQADWKKYSGTISGIYMPPKGNKDKNFWTGTVSVRPIIMLNWNWTDKNTSVRVRNITLTIEK